MRQTVPFPVKLRPFGSKRMLTNMALILGTIGAASWLLFGAHTRDERDDSAAPMTEPSELQTTLVRLPAKKLAAAAIETRQASVRSLSHTHTVPGRIEYDASRRLQLRLPAECFVKRVLVHSGQEVSEGAQLAVLTSKQIGLARDQVRHCEEDLRLAKYQQQWINDIASNVTDLLAALAKSPEMSEIEAAHKDRPLGAHRQEILAAYSDLLFAQQVHQDSATLGDTGVLSGRTLQERRNRLERARAAFQGVSEETKYHLSVEKQTAAMAVARAERALKISAEALAALRGPYGVDSETTLNDFVLTAPFSGRIEDRHITPAALVAANRPLFTLANTDHLWVSAQIHERNWRAASVTPGHVVRVRTPATGDREFAATIEFVGAVVDPETRALPLIARIENTDRLLKPGMFVWVSVPVEPEREALAVPSSAVMRHEGQAFVFVVDAKDRFRRVDIRTGLETGDWIEIRDGLNAGQQVVSSGAFALKSELLLEREEG